MRPVVKGEVSLLGKQPLSPGDVGKKVFRLEALSEVNVTWNLGAAAVAAVEVARPASAAAAAELGLDAARQSVLLGYEGTWTIV